MDARRRRIVVWYFLLTMGWAAVGEVAAEETAEKRVLSESLRLQWYGYLEGSYTQNFNNPSNRINQLRIFDVNSNQFRPNVAQFVLEREAKADGTGLDRLGFHIKFNAGRDSDFIGGTNLSKWADFQEFYVQYIVTGGYVSWQMAERTSAVVEAYYVNQSISNVISSGRNAR